MFFWSRKMNINMKGREIWIDYLKAIAIFLVVFNHLVGYQYAEFFSSTYKNVSNCPAHAFSLPSSVVAEERTATYLQFNFLK